MSNLLTYYVIIIQLLSCYSRSLSINEEEFELSLGFNDAKEFQLNENDEYVCRAFNFQYERDIYVNGFEPLVNENSIHHALLVQCSVNDFDEPKHLDDPVKSELYRCGIMYSEQEAEHDGSQICGDNEPYRIIYVWAHHATRLMLDQNISFNLGQSFRLVLQLHFNKPIPANTESSRLLLHATHKPTPLSANIFLLFANKGIIPKKERTRFELYCKIEENIVLYPIAFRVHGHSNANKGIAFRVRPNSTEQWSLIGSRSIQEPQIFQPIYSNLTISKGDFIAFVCTMNNEQDHDITIGHARSDEMCNFYLMYYTQDGKQGMEMKACGSAGPPYDHGGFKYNSNFKNTKIPYELFN